MSSDNQPVTLVTGASRGIGRYLVDHYLGRGHILVGCSRGPSDLSSARYFHFEADVTDEAAVKTLFRFVRRDLGRLDHLVNNAGVAAMNHALLTPMETVNKVMATNVAGTFLFCRESAKMMQKRRYGRIVNFSTVAVPLKLEGEAVYAASKAAVETLTAVLAAELGEVGITVNAVGPAPIDTDLIRGVPRQKIDALVQRQAIRRMATLADIANVTDFFLSADSEMVTGQTVYLGGV